MSDTASEVATDQATDAGGSENLGWRAALPDDLKTHEFIKGYAKPGDAIRDFVTLKQEAGNMLKVPGEDATDEDRAAFYAKLGRPESFDKYEFGKPEGLPEEIPYDETVEAAFKQFAFDKGLSNSQAAELNAWYYNNVKQGMEIQKQATEKAIDGLKGEWKNSFDENTKIAARAFKQFGGEEAQAFIDNARIDGVSLGDHPVFLKIFHAIGSKIGDDTMGSERSGGNGGAMSPEDAAKARFPNTKF